MSEPAQTLAPDFPTFVDGVLRKMKRGLAIWHMHERTNVKLRRIRRHLLLVRHGGQIPKARRRKRGGKRLL